MNAYDLFHSEPLESEWEKPVYLTTISMSLKTNKTTDFFLIFFFIIILLIKIWTIWFESKIFYRDRFGGFSKN